MTDKVKRILTTFFSKKYENKINNAYLKGDYDFDSVVLMNYVCDLISIPVSDFIDYIISEHKREGIVAADVFQFSDLDVATVQLCNILKGLNNPGLTTKDIGLYLQNDGVERTDLANTKYGENHVKTAEALGLAFKNEKRSYYLSGVGSIYADLNINEQSKLLTRLIIRNKLIKQIIILSTIGNIELETVLYDLSPTTYTRRKSNIKTVISILKESKEYDFESIVSNIIY